MFGHFYLQNCYFSYKLPRWSIPLQNLSDDELAKLHVRQMVGGMPPRLANEHVPNFPEYPGDVLASFFDC